MANETTGDDLTLIKGIGAKLAQALVKNGVTTFVQIAALDGAAIAVLEATGDFKGNNDWQAWIAEAKKLSAPKNGAAQTAPTQFPGDAKALDDAHARVSEVRGAAPAQTIVDDSTTKTFDVSFPPPEGMPSGMLESAHLVVKSKSDRGFRRAGFGFTPAETVIPLAELTEAQKTALANEQELIVKLRLVQAD